jgi:hypothetical protein
MNRSLGDLFIYVDESIHDNLGFIVTAFVCSRNDLNAFVAKVLAEEKLEPGVNEFKSSSYMTVNPTMQIVRDKLFSVANNETKVALLISSSKMRSILGKDTMEALNLIAIRNGIDLKSSSVFFDQGIVQSEKEGFKIAEHLSMPSGAKLHFQQDSKTVMGIQIADALAHTSAQVLREQITGRGKSVQIGGEKTGYEVGTTANLGWLLLMSISRCFFVRQMLYPQNMESYDPRTNPVILRDMDDPATFAKHPDLLGWGVIVADNLDPNISRSVETAFGKIWLGCIH